MQLVVAYLAAVGVGVGDVFAGGRPGHAIALGRHLTHKFFLAAAGFHGAVDGVDHLKLPALTASGDVIFPGAQRAHLFILGLGLANIEPVFAAQLV